MTTLLSILHDPDGKLEKHIEEQLPYLESIYNNNIIIVITSETKQSVISKLKNYAKVYPINGIGNARRLSIKYGLETNNVYFHYCDFDRILYWSKYYPFELSKMISIMPNYDFLIFGRTPRAFNTHPELQKLTEMECNILFGCNIDILSGSRSFNHLRARKIINQSKAKGAGVDAEWPIISKQFHYIECEGLEYESTLLGIEKSEKNETESRIVNLNYIKQVILENNWDGRISDNTLDANLYQSGDEIQQTLIWSFLEEV